ncbi:MAG: YitT family protein [Bacteroidaceae bacterium]|nr:YitT family protein [Bacteroidaceae bacterium]
MKTGVIRDYVLIFVGMCIYAIGYCCFMLPHKIVTGGLGGICALIFYGTSASDVLPTIPAQYPYAIFNGILVIVAIIVLGWKFMARTAFAVVAITLLIDWWQIPVTDPATGNLIPVLPGDRFMSCVIGAICEGVGIATSFLAGGSSGGTDIIAAIINKYKAISLGRIILVIDFIIVASSYFILHDIESIVVGVVTLVMANVTLDFIMNSTRGSVQFLIITQKEEEIAQAINDEIGRGVTFLNGQGWYTRNERKVLLVLCKKRESQRLMRLIHTIDPKAFLSLSSVTGVYGEGFDKIKVQ